MYLGLGLRFGGNQTAGGGGGAAINPPVLTQTSAAGVRPLTWDTVIDATVFAGFFAQLQIDTASDFASPDQDLLQMITPSDIAAGDMTFTGFTSPVGLFYMRCRIWDGASQYSAWSNTITDTLIPSVPATGSRLLQLEASDSANLFQTITGTTAVASDGDPVGTWKDKNANGFDLAAPANDGTRPTYQTVNSRKVVRFDGVDSYLFRAASLGLYSGGACTIMIAGRFNTAAAARMTFMSEGLNSGSNPAYQIARTNTDRNDVSSFIKDNAGTVVANGPVLYDEGIADATDVVIIVTDNGSTLNAYIDGVAGTSSGYTRGTSTGWNRTSLGAFLRTTAEDFLDGDIHGVLCYSTVLGSTDLADLTTYGGYLQGRTI